MSLSFSSVLAFFLRTVRDIMIGMSYGLLYEMDFKLISVDSSCSDLAFLSLEGQLQPFSDFFGRRATRPILLCQLTLSMALKLSASDIDCPFEKDGSLNEEE